MEQLEPTLRFARRRLMEAGENSAVVFLGDLLPCCGMPDSGTAGRAVAEERLMMLVDAVRDYPGRVLFIPGERDWGRNRREGWESLLRMEDFIEVTLDRGNIFVPDEGLPGPHEVELADDIRLVALNTQWLLTDNERSTGEAEDYEAEEDADFYVAFEDLIAKRSTDDLIVLGHHPIYSHGRYGGHYTPKAHLFPLTLAWDDAYLPLPLVGTIAVSMRRSIGSEQHFSHERNAWMRENLERILLEHEDFIYASAHDYSLQLFESASLSDMQKYVVSGSASESEYVARGREFTDTREVKLTSSARGFLSLHYYDDASIWIEGWAVGDDGVGERIHEESLRDPRVVPEGTAVVSDETTYPDYRDSTIVLAPEAAYGAGWLQRLLVGSNHREIWSTPVEVPYLDMAEHGGLTPVKRGGGMQTTSIRLEGGDGHQYVLRSVNKDGQRFLPEDWRETFVAPISQDFLSYSHPHGAFVIPPLAEAAGVYHTNPKLVYVQSDPRLGIYRDLAGDMLMLFEERPHKDMSDFPWFGGSDDVVGAPEAYRRVTRDNDYRVDARALARARLLDMWLSDWDRHKDQWRWASFDAPEGGGKVYRPIPRDRDQAFNKLDFFLHPIIKPFLKFQDYRKSYGSLKGLTQNGRQQDHRFLSELSREDWRVIADSMQTTLTDEVIEEAFRLLPPPVFALHGEEMIEIGKVRRDKLLDVADEFYRLHARTVDVLGSDKHERFEVTRLNDDDTEVVVFKTLKDGEVVREIYRRVLHRDETDEVVLYGRGGDDQFVVRGRVENGITVRAVGGAGDDAFVDRSTVGGSGRKTRFYDSQAGEMEVGAETRVTISDDPEDNQYTGFFEYPRTYPFAAAWYTSDDGLVVLGGALRKEHGFRKYPYARLHSLSGSFATKSRAVTLGYSGTFKQVFGDWDVGLGLGFENPNNFRNFYGLGNETGLIPEEDARVRLGRIDVRVPFAFQDEAGWRFEVTPKVVQADVRDDQTVDVPSQPGLSPFTTEAQWYTGARVSLDLQYKDDPFNPRRGYQWITSVDGNLGLSNAPDEFATVESSLSLYASPNMQRQMTLAFRFGGAHTFGTFPFYASNALGGTTNLRGYRETRFSGRSSLYANGDLRIGLFTVRGDVFPGSFGAVGFFDAGRVWTDGESSSLWHTGYGGGVWFDLVGEVLLRVTVGKSSEDTTFLFGAGFFY